MSALYNAYSFVHQECFIMMFVAMLDADVVVDTLHQVEVFLKC